MHCIIFILLFVISLFCVKTEVCKIHTCTDIGQPCGAINGYIVGCAGYNTFCSYANYNSPTCEPSPLLNETCGIDENSLGVCAPGLICEQFVCVKPKYYKLPGEACMHSDECEYVVNTTRINRCADGKCFGPYLGEECPLIYVYCVEGYCNYEDHICKPFLREGEECNLYSYECDPECWCNPVNMDGTIAKCTCPKTLPEGAPCELTHDELCSGDNVCNYDSKYNFGVCGPVNKSSPTYLKECLLNLDCNIYLETCHCDFTTGKQTCVPKNLPYTNDYASILTEINQCMEKTGCDTSQKIEEIQNSCLFNFCPDTYCNFMSQPMSYTYKDLDATRFCRYQTTKKDCASLHKKKYGEIVGIVIGVIIFVAIVTGFLFYVYKLKTNKTSYRYPAINVDETENLTQDTD